MSVRQVSIAPRFCGPSSSGNGGYSCGLLAGFLPGAVEVTLRAPPPLGVELEVRELEGDKLGLLHDETLVAEACPTSLSIEPPAPVSFHDAEVASRGYPGFRAHPYPTCFVCGPSRPHADGLSLYPGAVAGRELVAAPFRPAEDLCDAEGRVLPVFMWAALDCPSWFGYAAFHEPAPSILLGRLSADVRETPRANEPCVVVGWALGREGRKIRCALAVLGEKGNMLGIAHATWIVLKE